MKKRSIVLILLTALGVITFIDRLNIAVAANDIIADLNLTDKQWGWIMSSFILSYGLFQIPLGLWGDKKGQHLVLTAIVIWWSVFTGFTGVAGGFVSLMIIRFMFGIGEAGAYPNMTGSISKWFPKAEVGKAQGWIWAASRFGGALAPFTVIPLIAFVGWRMTFIIFGVIGIIWGVIWYAWYKNEPSRIKGIKKEELDEITQNRSIKEKVSVPWKSILKNRQFWLILTMYWFYVWGSWFFFSWFPKFLENGRGFEKSELTYAIAIPFLMGVIGNIAGGYLSDKLSKKYGLKFGRRLLGVGGLALSSVFMFLGGFIHGKLEVFIFMSLCFGIMDLMLPSAWAICIDVGKKYAGAISGAMNTAGNLGGFVCVTLFGYLLEAGGSYDLPLYIISGMLMISAFLFLGINPEKKIEDV
ncbi:MAG: MFS transporter [Bacteroidales bacterium]|nr:MFS transporter [Bacteroidales bacterium]